MKAVLASGAGGPASLSIAEMPTPTLASGEVLLKVAATAVNRADLLQRDGHYPPPRGESEIIGLEASGEIVALGDAVDGWAVGDQVMALLAGGGYAEYVAVPAGQLMPVPDGIDVVTAAAIPEVFLTAYLTLVRLAAMASGDVVLVHAGGSGVGTAAVQIARALDARSIATSRSAHKLALPTEFGATPLIVADATFSQEVREMTDGRGADIILDLVGAAYLAENVAACARGGRIILTGLVAGRRGELDLGAMIAGNITVIGSTLRGRSREEKTSLTAEFWRWAESLFADGTLRPIVDSVVPLDAIAQAHQRIASDQAVGKVVVSVSE